MMLSATHTDFAPWTLIDFNDQPLGRLTCFATCSTGFRTPSCRLRKLHGRSWRMRRSKERFGVLEPIAAYPVDSTGTTASAGTK